MDPSPGRSDYSSRPDPYDRGAQGGWASGIPILLDLNGNGIEITELGESRVFMDSDGDGLSNRTAWAGAGDAVLFYDPDGRNAITEARQYIFSEWDPTAGSDVEALRAVFDTNGDGKLTAADAEFAKFKLMVTNANGSTSVVTLASLGIVELDLTPDSTRIEFADGSVIDGQATFTRANGTTGTLGSTILVSEVDGYRVTEAVSTDGSGNRVVVATGYGADGRRACRMSWKCFRLANSPFARNGRCCISVAKLKLGRERNAIQATTSSVLRCRLVNISCGSFFQL